EHNWARYQDKHVAITCSADAIVPTWAYMLLSNKLSAFAKTVVFGTLEVLETVLFDHALSNLDIKKFRDQRVVVKGCGDIPVPIAAYVDITARLSRIAKSIMYGGPCLTVPSFKRKT